VFSLYGLSLKLIREAGREILISVYLGGAVGDEKKDGRSKDEAPSSDSLDHWLEQSAENYKSRLVYNDIGSKRDLPGRCGGDMDYARGLDREHPDCMRAISGIVPWTQESWRERRKQHKSRIKGCLASKDLPLSTA
jgi:hypothetical protein